MQRLVAPVVLLLIIISAIFIFANYSSQRTDSSLSNDQTSFESFATDLTFSSINVTDSSGKQLDLKNSLASADLITFWNPNCNECDTLLPILNQFGQDHPDIKQLLISYKTDVKIATDKLNELKVNLPNYFDINGQLYTSWKGTMPSSYYIKDGKIIYFFPGRISQEYLEKLAQI